MKSRAGGFLSFLLLVLLSEMALLVSVYSALITAAIRSIFRPEEIVREVILTPIKDELDCIIAKLVANYAKRHLEYALERVTFGIAQARLQLALGTGQLERVGVTPLLLGALLTGYTLWPKLFPDGLATDWSAPSNSMRFLSPHLRDRARFSTGIWARYTPAPELYKT